MMNLLNKLELDNKKIYLIILVFIILIFLDFTFVIRRQLQNIKNIQPKIIKLKKDLDALNKDLAKIQELKNKQVGANQKPAPKVKKIIPDPQTVSLLQNISEVANRDGVQIMQIKSSKETQSKQEKLPVDKFTPLVITLDLVSDYHHFGRFINDLENSQTFIAVESFKINSQQPDYIKQKISLVLKTYVTK